MFCLLCFENGNDVARQIDERAIFAATALHVVATLCGECHSMANDTENVFRTSTLFGVDADAATKGVKVKL